MIYNPVKNVIVERLVPIVEQRSVEIAEETNSRVGIFKSEQPYLLMIGQHLNALHLIGIDVLAGHRVKHSGQT